MKTTGALLSRERRAEIAARADAATPGPWESTGGRFYATAPGGQQEAVSMPIYEFLRHAREDVPDLLAESAALRGLLRAALAEEMDQDLHGYKVLLCGECRGNVFGDQADFHACDCKPGESWLRDAIAAGLQNEEG